MQPKRFNSQKFVASFKVVFTVESILLFIFLVIWMISGKSVQSFPFGVFTLGISGLLLAIAGCVGPGRYKKEFSIILCTPRAGSSFSEEIFVSGFTLLESGIDRANIHINGKNVGTIPFINNIGRTSIPRESVPAQTINSVVLKTDKYSSNKSYFTFFEYTEDLTDDEIESFIKMEENESEFNIIDAREQYFTREQKNVGSMTWGIIFAAILTMLLGSVYELISFS